MTFEEIVQEVSVLSFEQRKQLIDVIVDSFINRDSDLTSQHNILDFEGVGEHLRDMDAQAHVNQLRDEWDHRS